MPLGSARPTTEQTALTFISRGWRGLIDDDEVMLNVFRCQLTYSGQAVTNAEAWFNIALRPRKPEGSLGRTALDGHLDSHTAPELLNS